VHVVLLLDLREVVLVEDAECDDGEEGEPEAGVGGEEDVGVDDLGFPVGRAVLGSSGYVLMRKRGAYQSMCIWPWACCARSVT